MAQHSETKVKILREKYSFTCPEHASLDEYMLWFGSTHNVKLPWENPEERKLIIKEKAAFLASKIEEADEAYIEKARISPEDIQQLLTEVTETSDVNSLKEVENRLSDAITSHNEEYFIKVLSKTKEEREAILDKFEDILANEDMSALWLEVNTWKSLIAIDGEQVVKRNFKNFRDELKFSLKTEKL